MKLRTRVEAILGSPSHRAGLADTTVLGARKWLAKDNDRRRSARKAQRQARKRNR